MNKYQITSQLGDGTFGTVYRALSRATGEAVAIKKMKQAYPSWEECLKLPEVVALQKLKASQHIIRLREVFREHHTLYFVFDCMDGDLLSLIKKGGLPLPRVRSYMLQILQGIAHIHRSGYFHRDMKPENILFRRDGPEREILKIADFGLVKEVRSTTATDYVSTRWYRAPELLLQDRHYNSPVDIFAVACIGFEMLSGQPLFPGSNERDQLLRVFSVLGTPTQQSWPEACSRLTQMRMSAIPPTQCKDLGRLCPKLTPMCVDLLGKMLALNPKERITAAAALQHPFFTSAAEDMAPPRAMPLSSHDLNIATTTTSGTTAAVAANAPPAHTTKFQQLLQQQQQTLPTVSKASSNPPTMAAALPSGLSLGGAAAAAKKQHQPATISGIGSIPPPIVSMNSNNTSSNTVSAASDKKQHPFSFVAPPAAAASHQQQQQVQQRGHSLPQFSSGSGLQAPPTMLSSSTGGAATTTGSFRQQHQQQPLPPPPPVLGSNNNIRRPSLNELVSGTSITTTMNMQPTVSSMMTTTMSSGGSGLVAGKPLPPSSSSSTLLQAPLSGLAPPASTATTTHQQQHQQPPSFASMMMGSSNVKTGSFSGSGLFTATASSTVGGAKQQQLQEPSKNLLRPLQQQQSSTSSTSQNAVTKQQPLDLPTTRREVLAPISASSKPQSSSSNSNADDVDALLAKLARFDAAVPPPSLAPLAAPKRGLQPLTEQALLKAEPLMAMPLPSNNKGNNLSPLSPEHTNNNGNSPLSQESPLARLLGSARYVCAPTASFASAAAATGAGSVSPK